MALSVKPLHYWIDRYLPAYWLRPADLCCFLFVAFFAGSLQGLTPRLVCCHHRQTLLFEDENSFTSAKLILGTDLLLLSTGSILVIFNCKVEY